MTDIYKIGVQLAMTSNHAQVFQSLASGLLGLNAKVKEFEKGWTRVTSAIAGAATAMAGIGIIKGLDSLVKAGSEITHQQELMKTAGMANKEIAEATAKAYQNTARVQTTTIAQNLEFLRELRYAFGNLGVAENYLEPVTKANSVLNATRGGGTNQVFELVKSLEQKGITADPQSFLKYVEDMTKVVEATGGRVTPQMFMSTFKYGRTATLGWDETFITQFLPRLIQSLASSGGGGGSGTGGPGNALMTAFSEIVGGSIKNTAAQAMEQMGLLMGGKAHAVINEKGKLTGYENEFWKFDKYGNVVKSLAPGGIAGGDLFQKNPYEWVQQVLIPHLREHGVTSQEDIITWIQRMFQARTASSIITEMALQGRAFAGASSTFEKDAALARRATGAQAGFDELSNRDWQTVVKEFQAQWESLIQALGAPLVADATRMLKGFTGELTALSQWAGQHGDDIRRIGEGLAILGASLIGAGGIAILGALGPAGWLILGIGALGAALAAFQGTWLGQLADQIGKVLVTSLQTLADVLKLALIGAVGLTITAVGTLVAGIEKLVEGFTKLKNFLADFFKGMFKGDPDAAKKFLEDPYKANPYMIIPNAYHPGGGALYGPAQVIHDGVLAALVDFAGGARGGGDSSIMKASWGFDGGPSVPSVGGNWHPLGKGGIRRGHHLDFSGGSFSAEPATSDPFWKAVFAGEGTHGNYNTVLAYGRYGGKGANLEAMNLNQVYALGRQILHASGSGASPMGAFQIVGKTMMAAAHALGLDPETTKFDRITQWKMARWILATQGSGAWAGLHGHHFSPDVIARAMKAGPASFVGSPPSSSGTGWDSLTPEQQENVRRHTVSPRSTADMHQREHQASAQPIHNHIYMDGKKMAEIVTHHQTKNAWSPRQAPYHNSRAYPTAPDIGFATG